MIFVEVSALNFIVAPFFLQALKLLPVTTDVNQFTRIACLSIQCDNLVKCVNLIIKNYYVQIDWKYF